MVRVNLKDEVFNVLKGTGDIAIVAIETGKNTTLAGVKAVDEIGRVVRDTGLSAVAETLKSVEAASRITGRTLKNIAVDGVVGLVDTIEDIGTAIRDKRKPEPEQ